MTARSGSRIVKKHETTRPHPRGPVRPVLLARSFRMVTVDEDEVQWSIPRCGHVVRQHANPLDGRPLGGTDRPAGHEARGRNRVLRQIRIDQPKRARWVHGPSYDRGGHAFGYSDLDGRPGSSGIMGESGGLRCCVLTGGWTKSNQRASVSLTK